MTVNCGILLQCVNLFDSLWLVVRIEFILQEHRELEIETGEEKGEEIERREG